MMWGGKRTIFFFFFLLFFSFRNLSISLPVNPTWWLPEFSLQLCVYTWLNYTMQQPENTHAARWFASSLITSIHVVTLLAKNQRKTCFLEGRSHLSPFFGVFFFSFETTFFFLIYISFFSFTVRFLLIISFAFAFLFLFTFFWN